MFKSKRVEKLEKENKKLLEQINKYEYIINEMNELIEVSEERVMQRTKMYSHLASKYRALKREYKEMISNKEE